MHTLHDAAFGPSGSRNFVLFGHASLSNLFLPVFGSVNQALLNGQNDKAEEIALWHKNVFGKDLPYLKVVDSSFDESETKNFTTVKIVSLDDFYKQRSEQLERTKGQNRSNNRTFEDDIFNNGNKSSHGKMNDWDKITSALMENPNDNKEEEIEKYQLQ